MSSEWKEVEIEEIAKLQGGYAFKGKDFQDKGVPVAKIKNVKKGNVDLEDCGFVNNVIAESNSSFFVKKGDVLISMTGSGVNQPNSIVGRVARHSGNDNEFLINQRVGRFIIKNEELIDRRFLYYYLSPKQRQWEFVSIATGSANQVNISGKQIEGFKINLPPLPEQKAIAHILGTLDDKIELNRKMNDTLEQTAQALFKSWFVDFDPVLDNAIAKGNSIPDALKNKAEQRKEVLASGKYLPDGKAGKALPKEIMELFPSSFEFNDELEKWVPAGWEVFSIENCLTRLKVSNRYKKSDVLDFGKTPVYEQGANILLGYHNNAPDITADIDNPAFIFGDHTCVMKLGVKGFSISSNVISLKGSIRNTIWTYYSVKGMQEFEEYRRHWMELINKVIILPPKDICDMFALNIKELLVRKDQCESEILSLTKQRDVLLPQLISGKLRVSDDMVEKMIKTKIV